MYHYRLVPSKYQKSVEQKDEKEGEGRQDENVNKLLTFFLVATMLVDKNNVLMRTIIAKPHSEVAAASGQSICRLLFAIIRSRRRIWWDDFIIITSMRNVLFFFC